MCVCIDTRAQEEEKAKKKVNVKEKQKRKRYWKDEETHALPLKGPRASPTSIVSFGLM